MNSQFIDRDERGLVDNGGGESGNTPNVTGGAGVQEGGGSTSAEVNRNVGGVDGAGEERVNEDDQQRITVDNLSLYNIAKSVVSGAPKECYKTLQTSQGPVGNYVVHITGAPRIIRALSLDVHVAGPSIEWNSQQLEAMESQHSMMVTKGHVYRLGSDHADRFSNLVRASRLKLGLGDGTGLARLLVEALRLRDYGWGGLGIGDANFWANADIEQYLEVNEDGVLGPVDWLKVEHGGAYLGRFMSPALSATTRFSLIWPQGFRGGRGDAYVLSLLMMQGTGKGVVWYNDTIVDIRPPTVEGLPGCIKYVVAWLAERAHASEKAIAASVHAITTGVATTLSENPIDDGVCNLDDPVAVWYSPDRYVVDIDNGIVVDPFAIPRVLERTRARVAALEAAGTASRNNVRDCLAVVNLGRGNAAALKEARNNLFKAERTDANARLRLRTSVSCHGELVANTGISGYGRLAGVIGLGGGHTYACASLSPVGWAVRCTDRFRAVEGDGSQFGFDTSDYMLAAAYLCSDMGAVSSALPFWDGVPTVANYVQGHIRSRYTENRDWHNLLVDCLIPEGALAGSGDVIDSGMVRVEHSPLALDWFGTRPMYSEPSWTAPNVIPIGLSTYIMGQTHFYVKGLSTLGGSKVEVRTDEGYVPLIVSEVAPGMVVRYQRGQRMEVIANHGGMVLPLHVSSFIDCDYHITDNSSTHVIPWGSMININATVHVGEWADVSGPQIMHGTSSLVELGGVLLANTSRLISVRRPYSFRRSGGAP